jgi:hypothetical protein
MKMAGSPRKSYFACPRTEGRGSEVKKEEKRPPGDRPAPPVIHALDADGDGTISATEMENAPESLKKLDKNEDGELSPPELRPHGPPPAEDSDGEENPPPDANEATAESSPPKPCAPIHFVGRSVFYGSQKPWILSISRRSRLVGRPFAACRWWASQSFSSS